MQNRAKKPNRIEQTTKKKTKKPGNGQKQGGGQKVLATKSKGDNLGQRRSEERIACQEPTSLTTPFESPNPNPLHLLNSVLMTAKIE